MMREIDCLRGWYWLRRYCWVIAMRREIDWATRTMMG
jgi:hypothetical protein